MRENKKKGCWFIKPQRDDMSLKFWKIYRSAYHPRKGRQLEDVLTQLGLNEKGSRQ